jgi:hypothetical protein
MNAHKHNHLQQRQGNVLQNFTPQNYIADDPYASMPTRQYAGPQNHNDLVFNEYGMVQVIKPRAYKIGNFGDAIFNEFNDKIE